MLRVIIITLLLSSCFLGEELPEDQKTWKYNHPEKTNLSGERLLFIDTMLTFAIFGNINALLISKDDKLVFENYYARYQRTTKRPMGTISPILANIALGFAFEDGYFDSLNHPIHFELPEYADLFNLDPIKKLITLDKLMSHNAGLSWNESLVAYKSENNDLNKMKIESDWAAYVIGKSSEAIPGTRATYNSGSAMLISKIISNVTGISAELYLTEKLKFLIDPELWEWKTDPSGTTNLADGITTTPMEFLKLGYLFEEGGIIKLRSVMSNEWIVNSTIIQTEFSNYYNIGYYWQIFSDSYWDFNLLEINDSYFITNESGDHLYVIPHKNMIIFIEAENYFESFFNPSLSLYQEVIKSIN